MDEFERNVVHKHHDNVTQWVNEFSKKRGWFVQVWIILVNCPTDDLIRSGGVIVQFLFFPECVHHSKMILLGPRNRGSIRTTKVCERAKLPFFKIIKNSQIYIFFLEFQFLY